MIIAYNKFNTRQSSFFQTLEKPAPVRFRLTQRHAYSKDFTPAVGIHANGRKHRTGQHTTVFTHFFIMSIQNKIRIFTKKPVTPPVQLLVECPGNPRYLCTADVQPAHLLQDIGYPASGYSFDVHFCYCQFQCSFAATASLKGRWVKVHAASDLRHIHAELADSCINSLWLISVGITSACVGTLVQLCSQGLIPLDFHRLVEQNPQHIGKTFKTIFN